MSGEYPQPAVGAGDVHGRRGRAELVKLAVQTAGLRHLRRELAGCRRAVGQPDDALGDVAVIVVVGGQHGLGLG